MIRKDIKTGDKITLPITTVSYEKRIDREGTVIYIHPKFRYITVQFPTPSGKFRIESFCTSGELRF